MLRPHPPVNDDAALPKTLEYIGEFGPELVLFLPFVNYLSQTNQLGDRVVRTYRGMRPFYEAIGVSRIDEKEEARTWLPPHKRPAWLPRRDEHSFDNAGPSDQLRYPDMRTLFSYGSLLPDIEARISRKPLLIIHNKFNVEWDKRPFNHLSLRGLRYAFARLSKRFTVVYIRHGKDSVIDSFSDDHNTPLVYCDADLLVQYPDIIDFDELYERQREQGYINVNDFKARLYARCYFFITSQGGGSQQIAQYSGSLMCVHHRRGKEESWAYSPGYFTFMSDPPPMLLLSTNTRDLKRVVDAFNRADVTDGHACLSMRDKSLLKQLAACDLQYRSARARKWLMRRERVHNLAKKLLSLARQYLLPTPRS